MFYKFNRRKIILRCPSTILDENTTESKTSSDGRMDRRVSPIVHEFRQEGRVVTDAPSHHRRTFTRRRTCRPGSEILATFHTTDKKTLSHSTEDV